MATQHSSHLLDVEFWASRPAPCPYLPDRQERKILTRLEPPKATPLYELLIRNGFRRSHAWAYRPQCEGCKACVPVRVEAAAFVESRNQRRVRRRNAYLTAEWRPPEATEEQFELFAAYIATRHQDGDMAGMGWEDYRAMIEDAPVRTGVVEWRDKGGALRAAMLVDRLIDGISAVYSFFHPDDARLSPGTFMVLDAIAATSMQGLDYLYLGYWVADSRKMAYKSRFQPLQGLTPRGWLPLVDGELSRARHDDAADDVAGDADHD